MCDRERGTESEGQRDREAERERDREIETGRHRETERHSIFICFLPNRQMKREVKSNESYSRTYKMYSGLNQDIFVSGN